MHCVYNPSIDSCWQHILLYSNSAFPYLHSQILDMLLIVRDGRNLSLPGSSSGSPVSDDETVNPYLVFKVSPAISPAATHSQISWQCKNPQFVFHKVIIVLNIIIILQNANLTTGIQPLVKYCFVLS